MTPGRDNTEFTYIEARVHGELELLDIVKKKKDWNYLEQLIRE